MSNHFAVENGKVSAFKGQVLYSPLEASSYAHHLLKRATEYARMIPPPLVPIGLLLAPGSRLNNSPGDVTAYEAIVAALDLFGAACNAAAGEMGVEAVMGPYTLAVEG